MAKGPSPLLGYNTNVRHRGRVFHIQTEDSGVQHPHIITHLFADGGRILKSVKSPYGELLETADWTEQVKKMMQDQHKAMFIALRDGQYDHLWDPNAKPPTAAAASGSVPAITGTGQFRAVKPTPPVGAPNPAATAPPASAASTPTGAAPSIATSDGQPPSGRTGKYQPVRSPEILGSFKSKPDTAAGSGSIFGDSLMSEKSLDEVILAYLADDLEDKS